jgi:hypothetical protein
MSIPPAPGEGTKCAAHPTRPATVFCGACYRPICEECRDLTALEPRCTRCSMAQIVADVRQEQAAKRARRGVAPSSETRIFSRYAVAATLVMLCLGVIGTFPDHYIEGRSLYASNRPFTRSPGLNGCLRELWRIRKKLDEHVARGGRLPASLNGLLDGRTPYCPSCGQPYLYRRLDATHYIVLCPQPELHLVGEVHVDSGSAPTILDRAQHPVEAP